jgi:Tol biopolymer transport system component/DNA-binding winged helix-turn-helix (wHTH) protein
LPDAETFSFGPYALDFRSRVLLLRGEVVPLSARTFDVLALLVAQAGRVVSKDEILNTLWPDASVEEGNIAVHVSLLRKALAAGLPDARVIETVPKRGYRFAVPVTTQAPGPIAAIVVSPPPVAAGSRRGVWFPSAAALATIAAALLVFTASRRLPQREPDLKMHPLTSTGGAGFATISPDGRQVAYLDNSKPQQTLWLEDVATQSTRPLTIPGGIAPNTGYCVPIFDADGRSILTCRTAPGQSRPDIVRLPLDGAAEQVLVPNMLGPQGVSPDGRNISFISYEDREMRLWVADASGGGRRVLKVARHPMKFGSTAWSPQGDRIAFWYSGVSEGQRFGRIGIVRVSDGHDVPVGEVRWSMKTADLFLKWAPDGKSLIVTGVDLENGCRQIYELSFPGLSPRRVTHDLSDYLDLSIAAHGQSLVTTKTDAISQLWLLPHGDFSGASPITSGTAAYRHPSWTSNGRVAAMTNGFDLIDPATGSRKRIPGAQYDDDGPQVSPDGREVAFVSSRGGTPEIWTAPVEGGSARRLTAEDNCGHPRYSPDGRWIVYDTYVNSELTVKRVPAAGGTPVRLSSANRIWWPVYSPDNRWIAVSYRPFQLDRSPRALIFPASGGEPVASFDLGLFSSFQLEWTPDGRALTWVRELGNVSNLWTHPIEGGAPARQLTNFTDGQISGFGWSSAGDLVLARGTVRRDVLLLHDFLAR